MKYKVLFPLLFLLACETASDFGLPEESYFVKYYGKDGNQYGIDFVLNSDGTIVMLGNSISSSPTDFYQIYVVKIDANGAILWERSLGLPDKNDYARDIEAHPDGRLVIVAETEMEIGNRDVYIKTLSQQGSDLDSARVALTSLSGQQTDEEVRSVSIVSGGFIVAGATTRLESAAPDANDFRDAMHLRFDNSLNWIPETTGTWSDITGLSNADDVAIKIIEVVPNSVYLGFGHSNNDFNKGDNLTDYQSWIFQLNSNGVPSNISLNFGDDQKDEKIRSVSVSPDQSGPGYILSGTSTQGITSETYLVKISKANNLGLVTKLAEEEINSIGTIPVPPPVKLFESDKVSIAGRANETFLMVNDDYSGVTPRIALTFLTRDFSDNNQPPLLFDGAGDDFGAQVVEQPDGKILLFGTMTLGGLGGQQKMVLMKLNPDGKLVE